jgi:hypothetical protein
MMCWFGYQIRKPYSPEFVEAYRGGYKPMTAVVADRDYYTQTLHDMEAVTSNQYEMILYPDNPSDVQKTAKTAFSDGGVPAMLFGSQCLVNGQEVSPKGGKGGNGSPSLKIMDAKPGGNKNNPRKGSTGWSFTFEIKPEHPAFKQGKLCISCDIFEYNAFGWTVVDGSWVVPAGRKEFFGRATSIETNTFSFDKGSNDKNLCDLDLTTCSCRVKGELVPTGSDCGKPGPDDGETSTPPTSVNSSTEFPGNLTSSSGRKLPGAALSSFTAAILFAVYF